VPEGAARASRTEVEVEPATFWDGQVAEIEAEDDAPADARREASTPAQATRGAATDAPLPLKKRNAEAVPLARPGASDDRAASGLPPLATAAGSLAIVLALFFVTAWVLRRGAPQAALSLPRDVVEVLGRAPLPGKQQVHLLRCGQKLLLVWAGAGGVETLTEITDPTEVDRLAGICRAAHPHSATAAFRNVFQQLAREPGAELLTGGAPKRSFLSGRRTEDDDV
jgi:flagellar biogenesis protein FliO